MTTQSTTIVSALVVASLWASACSESGNEARFNTLQQQAIPIATSSTATIGAAEPIRPLYPVDPDTLHTPMVSLGRTLFHDKRLSGDGTLNCASCHAVHSGGDDGLPTATGIRGQIGPINSPTVLNSGFNFRQFWDGRAKTLDDQARGPVEAGIEMGASWENVVARLNEDDSLKDQFKHVFGTNDITEDLVVFAIARFEESLVTPRHCRRNSRRKANPLAMRSKQHNRSASSFRKTVHQPLRHLTLQASPALRLSIVRKSLKTPPMS